MLVRLGARRFPVSQAYQYWVAKAAADSRANMLNHDGAPAATKKVVRAAILRAMSQDRVLVSDDDILASLVKESSVAGVMIHFAGLEESGRPREGIKVKPGDVDACLREFAKRARVRFSDLLPEHLLVVCLDSRESAIMSRLKQDGLRAKSLLVLKQYARSTIRAAQIPSAWNRRLPAAEVAHRGPAAIAAIKEYNQAGQQGRRLHPAFVAAAATAAASRAEFERRLIRHLIRIGSS